LAAALKHYGPYQEISDKVMKRYRDERKDVEMPGSNASRINLFWSNVQVLKSTLYTRPPKVDVSRLFKDYTDDVARVAGIILERLLNHDLEKDTSDFDVSVRQAIDDWLIVGTGQVWYRYEVETEQAPDEMIERITDECALSDYIYWRDFLCSPARTWQGACGASGPIGPLCGSASSTRPESSSSRGAVKARSRGNLMSLTASPSMPRACSGWPIGKISASRSSIPTGNSSGN
jgi:hypothetical protein